MRKIQSRYLCLTSEILEGKSKSFSISDEKGLRDISLYSILMGNIMPYLIPAHKGVPLSQGNLKEDVVTCPWHGWKYMSVPASRLIKEETV